MSETSPHILYCHCQYAQIIPRDVKQAVLRRICESGVAFEAVADLCEMAARRDPALQRLAASGALKIAACFPRAVKGLFHQAGADLSAETSEVLNMRTHTADEVCSALFATAVSPNLAPGKKTPPVESERSNFSNSSDQSDPFDQSYPSPSQIAPAKSQPL